MEPLYLLVNFGGPRNLAEIAPFLTSLLQDRDVIRNRWPGFLHRAFFGWVARKRALKIAIDYEEIGGKSPIYEDTEALAKELQERLEAPVLTFHRYLPATHKEALSRLENSSQREIRVLPLFPQFSFATTGSIARFLRRHLKKETCAKLRWIPSYPTHRGFISSYETQIRLCLSKHQIKEEEVFLLFSAHGVPRLFIETGDPYQKECEASFKALSLCFPKAISLLAYQSKFGRGEWITPATDSCCREIKGQIEGRKKGVIVPLSFTSDHIETLFEIEKLYLPLLREQGMEAQRCPALNLEPFWMDGIVAICEGPWSHTTQELIRS
jgi:ferrochelatase